MTTEIKKTVTCANCQHQQVVNLIVSTSTFGSPDLDTRPPEMKRSTIHTWVQRCESCGYCSSNIEKPDPHAQAVIKDQAYQVQLNHSGFPPLANAFRCMAILNQQAGDYAAATWSLIHSAWVCDDTNQEQQAEKCRLEAIQAFKKAQDHQQALMKEPEEAKLVLVDLLRRSGQFEQAQTVLATHIPQTQNELIENILKFQQTLLEKRDTAQHTIEEAFQESEDT